MKNFCSQFYYAIEYLPKKDQSLDEARMHTFILVYYVLFLICSFFCCIVRQPFSVAATHQNEYVFGCFCCQSYWQPRQNKSFMWRRAAALQPIIFRCSELEKNYSIIGNWQQKGQENLHTAIRWIEKNGFSPLGINAMKLNCAAWRKNWMPCQQPIIRLEVIAFSHFNMLHGWNWIVF